MMLVSPTPRMARGFTLVEVLIALVILAIALAATSRATHGSADSSAVLKNKLFATWVAQNRLAELQLAKKPPEKGEHSGEAQQGGARFQWKDSITSTKNEYVYRVEIAVASAATPDYTAAKLVGFLADMTQINATPAPAAPPPPGTPPPPPDAAPAPSPPDQGTGDAEQTKTE